MQMVSGRRRCLREIDAQQFAMVVDGYMEFQGMESTCRALTACSDLGKHPMRGNAQVVTHGKRTGIEKRNVSAAPFKMFK